MNQQEYSMKRLYQSLKYVFLFLNLGFEESMYGKS